MKKRSIVLRGAPAINEEGAATEVIKPGYLVKGVGLIAKQTATLAVVCPKAVALERDELGRGIDNTYQGEGTGAMDYANGDRVKVGVFKSGDEAVMYVPSGQNIVEDDLLQSNGAGLLIEGTGYSIARAMETLGVTAAETALRVQFL